MSHSLVSEPVLIVGAGPVGLTLACELGMRQVSVIVFDDKPGLHRHPKANTLGARTMEIYRKHGLSRRLRDVGLPPDRATDVGFFTRLLGRELCRVYLPSPNEAQIAAQAGDPRWPTPEPQYRITQMEVEPILLERARSFPSVDIRFDSTVKTVGQDDQGVTVVVETSDGQAREVGGRFLVGCDGGRSIVRRSLGIRFVGEEALTMDFLGGRMLATYIRAPGLLAQLPHRDTWMHYMMQPGGRSVLVVLDRELTEFLVHFQLAPDQNASNVDFAARLAKLVGEYVPHEIISQAEWRAGLGLVSDRYGEGRCFLAGDAVHLFTPTGGFGLNTGVEDVFNLGWKLAAVCKGVGGMSLLETYEMERKPIALRNTGFALDLARSNGMCPTFPELDDDTPQGAHAREVTGAYLAKSARNEFDTPGIQLGARYDASSIIVHENTTLPPDSPLEYVPTGAPGGRLPHAWLANGDALFDRLGHEFTLITLASGARTAAWNAAAREISLELTFLDLSDEAGLLDLLGAPCLLVRPDQHVAWRGQGGEDPAPILHVCLSR